MNKSRLQKEETPRCVAGGQSGLALVSGSGSCLGVRRAPSLPRAPGTHLSAPGRPAGQAAPGTAASPPVRPPALEAGSWALLAGSKPSSPPDFLFSPPK